MPQSRDHAFPDRAVRGGAHIAMNVTRRTMAYARPPTRKRLHRVAAPLLIIPTLMIVLALAAILLIAMVIVAAFFTAALALVASSVRRGDHGRP
jgi:uncharacterized membrane protein